MLYDKAKVFVQAGRGGDGCKSFRREAHVPKGGPDGGDGGSGADVILECDSSLRDLRSFKRQAHYRARKGGNGEGALRHGANGEALVLKVPPGTTVEDWEGSRLDFVRPGQRVTIAAGGQGGRGNKRFTTSVRQAPRFAERGLPGQEGWINLRLKLLADVGLVGLPNAGKSSLLARLTRARPKVADYPFTTIEPVLGALEAADRQLVIADIPGLIEGASEGSGLGHEFLAHIERTQLLVHVLSLGPDTENVETFDDDEHRYETIEKELAEHDPRLAELPRILVLSKVDLVTSEEAAAAVLRWQQRLGEGVPVFAVSSVTGAGVEQLASELAYRVPEVVITDVELGSEMADFAVFRPQARESFAIDRGSDGIYRVTGPTVDRLIAQHELDNEEALSYIEHRLKRIGVMAALEKAGFSPGDDVEIGGVVFELDPDRAE